MTLKDKILTDLTSIKNPSLLNQIFEFMQFLNESNSVSQESNKGVVLSFAGVISDNDADEISSMINDEFNNIEGEW